MKKLLKNYLKTFISLFKQIGGSVFLKNKSLLIALTICIAVLGTSCGKTKEVINLESAKNEAIALKTETKQMDTSQKSKEIETTSNENIFEGYKRIEVDGGDLSGKREAKVVVDIGFGDRKYYAFTNEHGQLVKVIADEVVLQDDKTEPVLSTGRYFRDEAKVPGVESKTLDEGHVIADSLGGVSNAYNITPQDSTLNRHGAQAKMEKAIRKAGGCKNFKAIITYSDTKTQIPSHYTCTYTLNGDVIIADFDNVSKADGDKSKLNEETNEETKEETKVITTVNIQEKSETTVSNIKITELDKKAEFIELQNISDKTISLVGWKIVSVKGNQTFVFSEGELEADAKIKIGDAKKNKDIDFNWLEGKGIWNNSKSDPAEVYDEKGKLVARYND